MKKYEMEYTNLTVNISDPNDLHIYVNNLDVVLGNTDNINQKISTLTEVLKEVGENDKGFLYLDDIDSEIRFQYLT
jgi:cell division septal protein FtsQ